MRLSDLDFVDVVNNVKKEINQMLERGESVPEPVFLKAPMLFGEAVRTYNIAYCSQAVLMCGMYDFTLTPTMQKVVTAAELARFTGESRENPEKLKRDSRNQHACLWVSHLVAVGCTIEEASEIAATMYVDTFPNAKPHKASTISKYWEDKFRNRVVNQMSGKTVHEDILKMHESDPELRIMWRLIKRNVKRTDKHKGNRRN